MKRIVFAVLTISLLILISACGTKDQDTIYGQQNDAANNSETTVETKEEVSEEAVSEDADATEFENIPVLYATSFSMKRDNNGCIYIDVINGEHYVCVPENLKLPQDVNNAVVISQPVENIYLAASSAMDLFRELDELDTISFCSTKAEDYSIEEAVRRIESKEIEYIGKYSAPDYEILLAKNCGLAIESTMISHTPEVKESLEKLGIPVFTEYSSYEAEPLGRLEWIKVYGAITGNLDKATTFFDEQVRKLEEASYELEEEAKRPKVAFFYVSSNGYVNVRKPGDYMSTMIKMAGGEYVPGSISPEDDNALSTMNINWEDFYGQCCDADIIVYNSTIVGQLKTIDDLIGLNPLFADFKAVKDKNVWCSNANMFQESSHIVDVILDLNTIISNADKSELTYIYRLE